MVRSAARALAELHTSGLDTAALARRTGADEADKAARRARLLEQYVPELASVGAAGQRRAVRVPRRSLPVDTLRPSHGSYKSSQLMVRDGAVFLVDFDQFCLADPALDVGYFLAYLRPGRALVPPGRSAGVVRRGRARRSARRTCDRLARAGRVRGHLCGHRRPRPGVRGRACCSRSRRGGPTGCTAPAPARWRRCSTRSRAASRPRAAHAGRLRPQPARLSTVSVPSVEVADVTPAAVRKDRHGGGRGAGRDRSP